MNKKTQSPSVTFRNSNVSSPGEEFEEDVYVNPDVVNEEKTQAASEVVKEPVYINTAVAYKEKTQAASGHRSSSCSRTCSSLAACWLILLLIVVPLIYFTFVIFKNNSELTAENLNLTSQNEFMLSENQELKSQNQELQTEKNNLSEQIEKIKTDLNELNVTQSRIDAFCHKDKGTTCGACQKGWILFQSSCYAYNNALKPDQRNWTGAQDDCRGKGSDLTAVADGNESCDVNRISNIGGDVTGYWIGLRAVGRKWKWIDGSDLINQAWVPLSASPVDGQCVISVQDQGWKSVNCADRNAWICEMKALTI